MFSKLCRSSSGCFKIINMSSYLKSASNSKHNCIVLPRCYIHDSERPVIESETGGIFEIPDLPMVDESVVLNTLTEPSFASLGLNNYTPSGLVQSILENVHVYLDLPWWACIGFTAILLRTCMLPVLLSHRRLLFNYQNHMSSLLPVIIDACKAKESGNSLLMLDKMKEFQKIQTEASDITMMGIMKPILIQGPIFLSVFMALRGMAAAPVASLTTGGLSWFTDLTVYDPYYILPIITASTLLLVLETGAEVPGPQGKTIKMLMRGVPVLTFVFICHFPSTLLLYWTCSNLFSLIFAFTMKIPKVQDFLNMPKVLPLPVDNKEKYGLSNVMGLMKSMQEVQIRIMAEEKRWGKEQQSEVLRKGMEAAEERKRLKNAIKVDGTIMDEDKRCRDGS